MAGLGAPRRQAFRAIHAAMTTLVLLSAIPVRRVVAQSYQEQYELALRRNGTPHLCNGMGKRYCGTAHEEEECPSTCQKENCANRDPSPFNIIIAEGRYDYVYVRADQLCVSTCRDNPRRGVCAAQKGFWLNSLFYCTNLDCSYTQNGAVSGCHQERDFFSPDCDVCTRLFPNGCKFKPPTRSPPPPAPQPPTSPSPPPLSPPPPPPPPSVEWLTQAPTTIPADSRTPIAVTAGPSPPIAEKPPEKPPPQSSEDSSPDGGSDVVVPPTEVPVSQPGSNAPTRDRFQLQNGRDERAGRSAVEFQFRLQLNPAAYSSFDGAAQVLSSLVAEISGARVDQMQHVAVKAIVNGQISDSPPSLGTGLSPHLVSGAILADKPLETAGNFQAAGFTGLLRRMLEVSGFMLQDNSLLVKVDLGDGQLWTGTDGEGQEESVPVVEQISALDVPLGNDDTTLEASSSGGGGGGSRQSPAFILIMVMFVLMALTALLTFVGITTWYCLRRAGYSVSVSEWRRVLPLCWSALRGRRPSNNDNCGGVAAPPRQLPIGALAKQPWLGVNNPLWDNRCSGPSDGSGRRAHDLPPFPALSTPQAMGASSASTHDLPDIPSSQAVGSWRLG